MDKRITPVALALIRRDDKILVEEARDEVKDETFFRLLGGEIEFGEKGAEAVRRELHEELGAESEVKRLVAILENLFTYEGEPSHEIDLIYECSLHDDRLNGSMSGRRTKPRGKASSFTRSLGNGSIRSAAAAKSSIPKDCWRWSATNRSPSRVASR